MAAASSPVHHSTWTRLGRRYHRSADWPTNSAAKWGQPVVVENRPGGDAFLAITAVLNAHDDHVLLFAPALPSPRIRCCTISYLTIRKISFPSRALPIR